MAERVPLTDEQLADWERQCGGPTASPHWRASLAPGLIAELRASRVREQELQQRIDKARALATLRVVGPTKLVIKRYERALVEVRAALTGAEPGADPSAGEPAAGSPRQT